MKNYALASLSLSYQGHTEVDGTNLILEAIQYFQSYLNTIEVKDDKEFNNILNLVKRLKLQLK